jgi:hypothetical protein
MAFKKTKTLSIAYYSGFFTVVIKVKLSSKACIYWGNKAVWVINGGLFILAYI